MATEAVESKNSETSLQTQAGAMRSRLVQRLLGATASLPQFVEILVETQAVVVAGTEAAGFLVDRQPAGEFALRPIAHIRPDNSSAEMRAAAIKAFIEIIKPCLAQGKDGAIEIQSGGDPNSESQYCLVTLLRKETEVMAVSCVITRCINMERAKQRLMSIQLVAGYFDLYTLRKTSEQSQIVAQSHQHVLQLATAVATAEGFDSAAMNLCNELATRTGATRVSLGWMKGHEIHVKALSHTEQFDKKQQLVKMLETTMEECVDQEEPVHFDPDTGGSENVRRSAQALSKSEGGNVILTLPLRRRADVIGAVTLEFPPANKLSSQASTGLSVAVDLLAPQLYDRYQNDRWLITKAGLSARELGKKIVGPQHTLGKVIAIASIAAFIFICVYSPMYRVSAPFQFDPTEKRKLEAPFEGQIQDVLVQPGSVVTKGQLLVRMKTDDLHLKLDQANATIEEKKAEYYKAHADGTKEADALIAQAQMKQAEDDADFYRKQIERGDIKSPFDGIVLSGDLTDQRDVPKKEGDELLVVASAKNPLRAKLAVSESDSQYLSDGQHNSPPSHGMLATRALPTEKYSFRIDRIVPLGEVKDGDNSFTVYAHLDQTSPTWSAGMVGEARIDIGHRPVIWIWTHKFVEFVRLKLWI